MEESIIAAIIAATIAALTGLANMWLSIHRNKQDGITSYRMQWINELREEFANVLSWNYYAIGEDGKINLNPTIDELRRSVYKISLLLNVKDDYDHKVLEETMKYLDSATTFIKNTLVGINANNVPLANTLVLQNNALLTELERKRKQLQKLVRVYLKTEWTRVKVESSIFKYKHRKFWKCFKGFQSDKAIQKFLSEYKD